MKNFKKVLALVLVAAVIFSFTAVSTAAFTDDAEITRNEAVDVMSAIGVINGYTDGSFKPADNVKRAEMAKMITILLNKGEDVGDLYKGACTFADSASHWAAGYIAYCAQENIINGRNASTFDPDANVTGTEAAKMLLCALGYNPAVEGLTGANWAANTLSLSKKLEIKAKNAGGSVWGENADFTLLDEMDNIDMTAPLNRENAAQMLLNAMQCTKVDYDGNAQTITIGNTSFTSGASLQSLNTCLYFDYNKLGGAKKLVKKTVTGDDFGNPATIWTRGGEDIGTYTDEPTITYTDAVDGGKIYTDLGKPTFTGNNSYTLKAYWNGEELKAEDTTYVAKRIVSGNTDNVVSDGSFTKIYVDDETMTITIVCASYYIAQINNVYAAKTDANGDVTREAYVTLKSIDSNKIPSEKIELKDGTKVDKAFITDEFTTADRNATYVVYTKAAGKIQSLVKAEVKSGVAGSTSKSGDGKVIKSLTLDSTAYKVAATADAFSADYGSDATIYLDPNGNILFAEATSTDAVAYVLTAGQTTDAIYGGVTTGAELLFADGTTKKVNVYNEQGKKYTEDTAKALKGTVVSYSVTTNDEYKLTVLGTATKTSYGYTKDIAKVATNNPSLDGKIFANDTTTFIVEKTTKDNTGAVTTSYTTYTGLKNVPTVENPDENADALVIAAVNSRTTTATAAYVFVIGGKATDSSKTSVSVFMANTSKDIQDTDANNNPIVKTKAVVDEQIVEVKMTREAYETLTNKTMTAFKDMTTDADGNITGMTPAGDKDKYVKSYKGFDGEDGLYNSGIITMKNSDATTVSYSVNADTPVFVFNAEEGKLEQTTVDAFSTDLDYVGAIVVMDSSEVILNNNEVVTAIYVSVVKAAD